MMDTSRYADFIPAWSVGDDEELGISKGSCVMNGNTMLLSCAGQSVQCRQ